MESCTVGGTFCMIMLGVMALAAPIALFVGGKVDANKTQGQQSGRRSEATVVAVAVFVLLVIGACLVLMIWNPRIV